MELAHQAIFGAKMPSWAVPGRARGGLPSAGCGRDRALEKDVAL
jgi:hypothetical protein